MSLSATIDFKLSASIGKPLIVKLPLKWDGGAVLDENVNYWGDGPSQALPVSRASAPIPSDSFVSLDVDESMESELIQEPSEDTYAVGKITRDGGRPAWVYWETVNEGDDEPQMWGPSSGLVILTPNKSEETVQVPIYADSGAEDDEFFAIRASLLLGKGVSFTTVDGQSVHFAVEVSEE